MSILQDIFDLAKDMTRIGDDFATDVLDKKRFTSVSRRAKEGTLQFPVIISKSISLEDAQMITKAMEKEFASMLQTSLTMSPFLNLSKQKDAAGYLRQFHQNSDVRTNAFNDALNTLQSVGENTTHDDNDLNSVDLSDEEGNIPEKALEGFTGTMEGSTPEMNRDLFFNSQSMMDSLHESTVSELYRPIHPLQTRASKIIMEAAGPGKKGKGGNTTVNNYFGKDGSQGQPTLKYELPRGVLTDNDVKKANELISTSMHVRTILTNKANEAQGHMDFMIGVKAMMHPVASDDIVENVTNGILKRGRFFKFVRWTTGEIQFVRDFLFNVSEIRDDVARTTKGNDSRWWSLLKRRRKIANLRKFTFLPGDILPNTSLVLSTEEVDYLKNNKGIDLEDITIVDKLMDQYFLIGLVIVDSSTGVAKFLFDGDRQYRTVTFSGLERGDMNGKGSDIKDVIKLVQRI